MHMNNKKKENTIEKRKEVIILWLSMIVKLWEEIRRNIKMGLKENYDPTKWLRRNLDIFVNQ
jgi:hypothetical protein